MAKVKKILKVDINQLIPYKNNAKRHDEKQIDKLVKSIENFGFISPVLIDNEQNIIAGHGRVEAAKKAGLDKVPCVSVEGLTEDQRKAYIIADNRLSEFGTWDKELVQIEVEALEDISFLNELEFSLPEIDLREYYGDERKRTNDAYNLDIAHETDMTIDFWQMPMIKRDNIIPDRLMGFNYAKTSKDKKVGIHFFIDDYQFERVWNYPEKYTDILKEYDCILSPDFSLYMDMPMPMKIWNVYRSRQVGSFYQSQGIKVIPTISWAEAETFQFAFKGIEKKSIVAVSTIGVKENEKALEIWRAGMNAMMDEIEPSLILIYGGQLEFDYKGIEVKYYDNEVLKNWRDRSDA